VCCRLIQIKTDAFKTFSLLVWHFEYFAFGGMNYNAVIECHLFIFSNEKQKQTHSIYICLLINIRGWEARVIITQQESEKQKQKQMRAIGLVTHVLCGFSSIHFWYQYQRNSVIHLAIHLKQEKHLALKRKRKHEFSPNPLSHSKVTTKAIFFKSNWSTWYA